MEICIIDKRYTDILFNDSFRKIIIIRTASPESNINLLQIYNIPIPKINDYSMLEVLKIVNRLKDIAKNIDWNTSEALEFMVLLETIAGKRNANNLAYLVFNECIVYETRYY